MHVSVSPEISGDSFLAGILTKLRVLCAFGLPSYDSYHRVGDDGAGRHVGWGTENRELPLRGIESAHWEYRSADTTANFYLLLAIIVKAGSVGLKEQMPLRWKDCRIFPRNLSEKERTNYGLMEHLPSSLEESINLLKNDADVREWIGEDFLEMYIKVKEKEKEIELFGKMIYQERRLKFLAFF